MKSVLYALSLTLACTGGTIASEKMILLDPSAPRQTLFETPLFGYKRFPEEIFRVQKGDDFGLPTEIIYTSASKVPIIEAAAAASGKDVFDLDASEIVALARDKQQEIVAHLRNERREIKSGQQSSFATSTVIPWGGELEVDATFITALVSSELVDYDFRVFEGELVGDDVQMISVNKQVGIDFWNAYSNLDNLKSYDPVQQIEQFQSVNAILIQYPSLLEAAKINFAPVSFGEIFVFSAMERDLNVPPPIARKYDVYWVEFPLSLRNVEQEYVTEVSFHVFLPDNSTAIDLIPWRFGTTTTTTEEFTSPTITVKDVAIGEFYKRTVAYTSLKPTIVATGLREHRFSWVLTEEAVSTGSYLFVGLLGVPKGQCSVSAGLAVNAETTNMLGFQGDVAGTGVIFTEIALPC